MKTLRYITLIVWCGLAVGATSCKELDKLLEKPPSDDTTIDDIFDSRQLATRAMAACYNKLPFGLAAREAANIEVKWQSGVGKASLDALTDLDTYARPQDSGPTSLYYPGLYNASMEQNMARFVKYSFTGEGQWTAIRRCWTIIENIDKVPDMTLDEKLQFKAEARVIIAIHYTEMLRHLGGVPKVDHVFLPNDDLNTRRMTIREMLEWIEELIDQSYLDLPWRYSDPNLYGRMTRVSALAVRVRALHFVASPLFNDATPYMEGAASDAHYCWLGEKDPELWKRVRDAADDLITQAEANGYGLVQPVARDSASYRAAYRRAYHEPNDFETLVITRCDREAYPPGAFNTTAPTFNIGNFLNTGSGQPTQNWAEMFPMKNGWDVKPGMPNYNALAGWDEQKPNDKREPRYYESLTTNNDKFGIGQPGVARLWHGGGEFVLNRYAWHGINTRKFYLGGNDTNIEVAGKPIVWPWIRMAEIYLIYAEAANQYEGSPSALAYSRVNAVRDRVGLPGFSGMTKEVFHAALMKERCCELGFENSRWFDMVRWKMEDVFKVVLRGQESWLWEKDRNTPAPYNTAGKIQGTRANSYAGDYLIGDGVIGENGVLYIKHANGVDGYAGAENFDPARHVITYQYYDIAEKDGPRVWAQNFSPKWYLSAFPVGEVNKGYGLVQNPGW